MVGTAEGGHQTRITTAYASSGSRNLKDELSFATVTAVQKPLLPKSVISSVDKFRELYKEQLEIREVAPERVIPYYSDVRTNQYALLGDMDQSSYEDPYDISLFAFMRNADRGDLTYFKDTGIVKEAMPILAQVATYIHKVYNHSLDWRCELGDSPSAQIFKLANGMLADLYWEKKTGKRNLLLPHISVQSFHEKDPKKKISYVTYEDLLRKEFQQYNTGDLKLRMANAYVYLIKQSILHNWSDSTEKWVRLHIIDAHKKFIPNITMFRINGYIPDVRIRQYKNLFLDVEWEELTSHSSLFKLEEEVNGMLRKQLDHDEVLTTVIRLGEIGRQLRDSKISETVRNIRRDRIRIAGELKGASLKRKERSFTLANEIGNNLNSTNIREAFNPFRISFVAGRIQLPPSECITGISWDEGKKLYTWTAPPATGNESSDRKVSAIGLAFVEFINK